MEIVKNVSSDNDTLEGEVFLCLFNKYVPFMVEDAANIEYVKNCANAFNTLSDDAVNRLCSACIKYCNSFLKAIGEPIKEFANVREVLALVYPSVFLVPNPNNNDEPCIHMELNCAWEEEHGMEWVIREGNILYVGAFNGEDPWSDYSEKEYWNYA